VAASFVDPGRIALLAGLLAATAPASAPASAREVPTGVPSLQLRLDGTFRYNLGLRTDPADPRLASSPTFTAGEGSVAQGGLTTNRLDLLAELDLAWAGRAGLRASAAGWYDDVYRDRSVFRTAGTATPGTYRADAFSSPVVDRYRGPYGEVLDAFAWARGELAGIPVALRAGRHTVSWGESLMLAGNTHGVGYAQVPLDLAKGFATPGVETKELFRPLTSLSGQAQVTPTLSVAAQVFLEWQPYLYPEGGTYLGGSDAAFSGPDGLYRPPPPPGGTYVKNGGISWPSDLGEWGVAVRWRPDVLDTTLGLYYRRLTDKFAAVLVTANPGGQGPLSPAVPSPLQTRQFYGEGVDLVGVSAARQLLGVSLGAEASFRHDMPLLAQSPGFAVAPAPALAPVLFPSGAPRLVGNTYQARGDTLHALVNAVGVVAGVPGFSSAAWALEVTYSRWLAVRENRDLFYAMGYGVCRGDPALAAQGLARDTGDGCATRDHVGLGAGLTPTWFQVLHGVDLLAPLSASWTVHGNSPVGFGGNEGSGTWGAGVAADVRARWRVDLRYVDFFGRLRSNANGSLSVNGLPAILQNRGSVTLTAKATF
jgi:hypothetical protein